MELFGRSLLFWTVVLTAALMAVGGGFWWYKQSTACTIVSYDRARDFDRLVAIFTADAYWLDERPADGALNTFVHELDLIEKPDAQPTHEGPMQWLVCRIGARTAGFISYYMTQADTGRVLYLGVDREYRHYGAGRALMHAAMRELEQQGAKTIYLATRVNNLRAQSLYKQLGFVQTSSTGSFIFMERYA